jgi:16S rRNA C967 or C1407 C5-methylase (RsmB/RsmF family)
MSVHLQADFLATDTAAPEFADVQAVLLDPSCSGSGTAHSRMDFLLPSQWQNQGSPADEVNCCKSVRLQLVWSVSHALQDQQQHVRQAANLVIVGGSRESGWSGWQTSRRRRSATHCAFQRCNG